MVPVFSSSRPCRGKVRFVIAMTHFTLPRIVHPSLTNTLWSFKLEDVEGDSQSLYPFIIINTAAMLPMDYEQHEKPSTYFV